MTDSKIQFTQYLALNHGGENIRHEYKLTNIVLGEHCVQKQQQKCFAFLCDFVSTTLMTAEVKP